MIPAETCFSSSFIVGGQIAGDEPRLFMVYPAGNFIESEPATPYFQLGETKYGKPILERVLTPETALSQVAKCALLSFDARSGRTCRWRRRSTC